MEFVKHKYSKRVYQLMRDHNPEKPYLSLFPFLRYPSQKTLEQFFTPCEGPIQNTPITIPQELKWEERQRLGQQPIMVKPPKGTKKTKKASEKKKVTDLAEEYTLAQLCGEIGMSPAKARKLLRSQGKTPPSGGWKWPNREAAKPIKRFLKKS